MVVSATPLSVAVFVSTVLATVLAYYVWQERPKTGASAMAASAFALALWSGGQFVVVSSELYWLSIAGLTVTYLGQAIVPGAWYVFGHQYTGRRERVRHRTLVLLAIWPAVVVVLGATNSSHELLWVGPTVTSEAGQAGLSYRYGIGTVAHVTYAYLLVASGTRCLIEKFLASRNVYRKRTLLFVFIAVSVFSGSAVSYVGLSPLPSLTLTPVFFLGLATLSLLSVTSNRFIANLPTDRLLAVVSSRSKNLTPAARATAIEEMKTGFVVTDHKNRIVDVNPIGRRMLGQTGDRIVGRTLTEILTPEMIRRDDTEFLRPDVTGRYDGIWVDPPHGESRCYDVTVNPLTTDADGNLTGRVGLLHDVTDRERRKVKLEDRTTELERKNDQLESFAGIVSHDLRNPLNVATGRLEIIEANADSVQSHTRKARNALERMENIISDVLTLARLGQSVTNTETVTLGSLAADAWEHVDTGDATLDCDLDREVEGSQGRLLQVFENLFRNSIEHGSEDLTVTVGALDDGFYVADDGPGIPERHRENVLEQGFTTHEDGTGLGLSIVRTIVEAHGWEISVTEGTDGGARFEITGLRNDQENAGGMTV